MPEIALQGVRKEFGAGPPAVADLTLTVPDGAFMCLLGPSGCGKTTTLRMIAGLEHPTEGRIAIGRFLQRFPRYALAGTPVRGGRARFRGFLSVPVDVRG